MNSGTRRRATARWNTTGGLLLLALAPATAHSIQEPVSAVEDPAPGSSAMAKALPNSDPLARDPADLPRAEVGRWEGLLEGEGPEHFAKFADASVLEVLAAAENIYQAGRYPDVVKLLTHQLEEFPDFPPALTVLGTTYFRLRRYGDTAQCFERFLQHAPGEVWRTQALGHAYHSLGRYQDAIDHYDRVLEMLPESTEAIRGQALGNLRLGRFDQARAGLELALEINPDHVSALCELAQLDLDEEELEAALDRIQRAKGVAPHEPRPWYLLSRIQFELGEEEAAEETRRRWREIDALTQKVRTLEGRLLYARDRYSLALELVELQMRLGDAEGVKRSFDLVINEIPDEIDSLEVFLYAMDSFQEVGAGNAALRAALHIEATFPDRVDAWRALERFYGERRDITNQVRAAERALRLGSVNDF